MNLWTSSMRGFTALSAIAATSSRPPLVVTPQPQAHPPPARAPSRRRTARRRATSHARCARATLSPAQLRPALAAARRSTASRRGCSTLRPCSHRRRMRAGTLQQCTGQLKAQPHMRTHLRRQQSRISKRDCSQTRLHQRLRASVHGCARAERRCAIILCHGHGLFRPCKVCGILYRSLAACLVALAEAQCLADVRRQVFWDCVML
jgi:hypothetical protein